MKNVLCDNCNLEYSLIDILKNTKSSSPAENMIFLDCTRCNNRIIILLEKDSYSTISYLSESNWEIKNTFTISELETRIDPEYLHCWYQKVHYEFPAH